MMVLTYKDVEKMKYDAFQRQFALDGSLLINKILLDENIPIGFLINFEHVWVCPFCLLFSNKFIVESHGLVKCPNCGNLMRMKTLIFVKDCTNQEYAKWVFGYRLSGFFKKVNFEQWKKRLHDLGMSYEFWEEFNKLKGENKESENKEIYVSDSCIYCINKKCSECSLNLGE